MKDYASQYKEWGFDDIRMPMWMWRVIACSIIALFVLIVVPASVRVAEKNECADLAQQKMNYTGFYAAEYQIDQCEVYGIHLAKHR